MADETPKTNTYIIGILHRHGDEYGVSMGRLEALDADDAERKAELWIARKKKEAECKPDKGHDCQMMIEKFEPTGMRAINHLLAAEKILPSV